MGGRMAASYAAKNAESLSGLIDIRIDSSKDLTQSGLPVLSITAELDTVVDENKMERNRENLPEGHLGENYRRRQSLGLWRLRSAGKGYAGDHHRCAAAGADRPDHCGLDCRPAVRRGLRRPGHRTAFGAPSALRGKPALFCPSLERERPLLFGRRRKSRAHKSPALPEREKEKPGRCKHVCTAPV